MVLETQAGLQAWHGSKWRCQELGRSSNVLVEAKYADRMGFALGKRKRHWKSDPLIVL